MRHRKRRLLQLLYDTKEFLIRQSLWWSDVLGKYSCAYFGVFVRATRRYESCSCGTVATVNGDSSGLGGLCLGIVL